MAVLFDNNEISDKKNTFEQIFKAAGGTCIFKLNQLKMIFSVPALSAESALGSELSVCLLHHENVTHQ